MNKKLIKGMIPYLGLVIVILFFSIITKGKILTWSNLNLIIGQLFTTIISAVGVVFVMSMGSLDFSQGSILGICCYVAAGLSSAGVGIAIVGAVAVGAVLGVCNGLLVSRLKIQSFVATICTMFVLRGFVRFLTSQYKVNTSVEILHLNIFSAKSIVTIVIVILGLVLYNYTGFGKSVRMIGAGEVAVEYSGIHVKNTKLMVFTLAGVMAGIAAVFSLLRTGSVISTTGNLLETDVMIALVLGGLPVTGGARSKYSSVIIGVLILAFLDNGLIQIGVSTVMQQLVRGIFFLIVIIVTIDRTSDDVNK